MIYLILDILFYSLTPFNTSFYLFYLTYQKDYLNILSRCGIRYEDSKVVSRSRNLLKIISKSLGYDKSSKISIEKLKYEIEEQLSFFTEIIEIFSQANDEDFVIYLLRYDLKKIKE